jgi:tetratricopeptide (TPR) repeat protein
MNSRLFCVLAGSVLLAGCGTTTSAVSHSTSVPATSAAPSAQATSTAPAAPTAAATQISSVDPKNPYKAGMSDLKGRNYASAARHFQQAISRSENTANAYAGLGNADLRLGKYSAAYRAYSRAATAQPTNASAVYGAALSAYTSKEFPAAVQYASQYIQLKPRVPAGYHLRMLAYDSLARPKPQLKDAQMIVKIDRHDPQAYNDLGIAYGNNKKYPQAIAAFTRAIALDPRSYSFFFNRAVFENLMKNRAAALADMKKAQKLAPTSQTKAAIAAFERRMQNGK